MKVATMSFKPEEGKAKLSCDTGDSEEFRGLVLTEVHAQVVAWLFLFPKIRWVYCDGLHGN